MKKNLEVFKNENIGLLPKKAWTESSHFVENSFLDICKLFTPIIYLLYTY